MNKAELIEWIQKDGAVGETKAAAERALEAVIKGIKHGLKTENHVSLVGFGSFRVTRRNEREGRNPRTGEKLKIKASKTVTFRAGKTLKNYVPMPKDSKKA